MIVVLVLLVAYAASQGKKSRPPRPPAHLVTFSPQIKRSALVPPRVLTTPDPFGKNTFG